MTTYPSNVMGIDEFVQSKASPRTNSEVMVFSVGTASSTSPLTGAHTAVDTPRGEQAPTPLSEVAMNELHSTNRRGESEKALFTVPSLMEPVVQSISVNSGVSSSGGVDENQENLSNDVDFDPDDFSWMNQPTNGEHPKDNAHDKDCSSHSIDQTYGIINRRENSISQTSTSPSDTPVIIINVFGERLMKKIKKEIHSVVSAYFDRKCGKQLDTMRTDIKTMMNLSLNHFPQLDVSHVIPIEELQAEYLLTLPMRNASHFAHFESLLLNNVRDLNTKLKRYIIATTSNTLDAVDSMRLIFKKIFYKEVLALYTAQKPSNTNITKPLFTDTAFYPALRDALIQVYNVGNVLKFNESCIKKAISSVFNAARTWTTPNDGSEDAVPKSSSG
ncbi:hypothetical protein QAD02_018101 [Eretmocerus hayati]|uniref:Uncharacterized protein n=1 Tax=Eretmocerus hayati TaxID=131215 RepID=A0ACC2PI98_9HYME|nr:hypothetical protein QAD02_018101 [Eretmocerus hayati]